MSGYSKFVDLDCFAVLAMTVWGNGGLGFLSCSVRQQGVKLIQFAFAFEAGNFDTFECGLDPASSAG